jgi:hypothetical protein
MNYLKRILIFSVVSSLWLSVSACKASAECECHRESAVEFVQVYYADLQEERADRIRLALDRWYPNRLPNDQKFIEQVEKIQYIHADAQVNHCWQESKSIVNISAEIKMRHDSEPSEIKGIFYLKCAAAGWKIFLAQRDAEVEGE